MALINCPECGKEISDLTPQCIHCGYKAELIVNNSSVKKAVPKVKLKKKFILPISIVLVSVSVLLIVLFNLNSGTKEDKNLKKLKSLDVSQLTSEQKKEREYLLDIHNMYSESIEITKKQIEVNTYIVQCLENFKNKKSDGETDKHTKNPKTNRWYYDKTSVFTNIYLDEDIDCKAINVDVARENLEIIGNYPLGLDKLAENFLEVFETHVILNLSLTNARLKILINENSTINEISNDEIINEFIEVSKFTMSKYDNCVEEFEEEYNKSVEKFLGKIK